jgi:hypothetical protein
MSGRDTSFYDTLFDTCTVLMETIQSKPPTNSMRQ